MPEAAQFLKDTSSSIDPELVERYTAAGWWGTVTVGGLVRRWAAERPDAAAIITTDRRASWTDYDALADKIALALLETQVAPGARVGIYLPDGLALHAALVAAQRAGVVAVGIGARAGDAEIAHLLRRTEARTLITLAEYRQRDVARLRRDLARLDADIELVLEIDDHDNVRVDGAPLGQTAGTAEELAQLRSREFGPNDLTLLNSTSGTTGLPKCVMQFENRWFHFSDLAVAAGELGSAEVFLGAVPVPFGFGLWTAHFAPAMLGAPTVVLPRFSADEMVRLIERERVTVLCCVSTQFRMLLNSPLSAAADFSSLRVMFTGGEAIPFEQAAQFERRTGAAVLQFFGSNETGAFSYTTTRDTREHRLSTAGRLIEHMNVRLFDDDGSDVTAGGGPGQPGGVGPLTCMGYYRDEGANAELFTADGWMLMGDLVTVEDGYLRVVGRKSDIVIRGGKNISAAAVEGEVGTHPAVALVAVVAVPDVLFGERVCALVSLRPGTELTLAELGEHLSQRGVTKEWHPEHLIIVDDIPRSSGGKVAKGEARTLARARLEELQQQRMDVQ